MEKIKIEIISTSVGPFRDTTVGEVYDAIVLKGFEEVPEPWCPYPGYKNDGMKSLLLIDDLEDDVAVNFDDFEHVNFVVVG